VVLGIAGIDGVDLELERAVAWAWIAGEHGSESGSWRHRDGGRESMGSALLAAMALGDLELKVVVESRALSPYW
jgi:hypothetical protein